MEGNQPTHPKCLDEIHEGAFDVLQNLRSDDNAWRNGGENSKPAQRQQNDAMLYGESIQNGLYKTGHDQSKASDKDKHG